tara:strand:+ start:874 stop:1947 length:1074 start_codon:yes stop_codon:yes gene_type:complete
MAYDKPTLSEQIEQMKVAMDVYLGESDVRLQHTYLNTIGTATSGAINGLYGFASYIEKQTYLDTADTENLERWGAIWGIPRTSAIKAEGDVVTFTGTPDFTVPIGTELKRSDDIRFVTTTLATLTAGTGTAEVEAVEAGATGNTTVGTILTLISPPIGVISKATVNGTAIVGGDDTGTDEELRTDIYDRIQTPPQGGNYADYSTWVLGADNVTRTWIYTHDTVPTTPIGNVHVLFMMDDKYGDGIPLAQDLIDVEAYVDVLRPVTVTDLTFAAPTTLEVDFTIEVSPNTAEVKANIQSALEDMVESESEPGGTLRLSRIQETISLAIGEDYHYLTVPSADVTTVDYELPIMGTITWV